MEARPGAAADRIVELVADLGERSRDRFRFGSGLVVGRRTVLTAAHVLEGAVSVRVRTVDKREFEAVLDPRSVGDAAQCDLAFVEVPGLPDSLDFVPVAIVDREVPPGTFVENCAAVGFPEFAERKDDDRGRSVRKSHQVGGRIAPLSHLDDGLLVLEVSSNPRSGSAAEGSPWAGMSGAAVFAGEHLVGVVFEHEPDRGSSEVLVTPVAHLSDAGRLNGKLADGWQRLGVQDPTTVHSVPTATAERNEAMRDTAIAGYLDALAEYCTMLPPWFPEHLGFTDIVQEVAVRPPAEADRTQDGEAGEEGRPDAGRGGSSSGSRRMPWTTALDQLQRILLVGDPGMGKSWAVRAHAVELADGWARDHQRSRLPVLVLAPKLEEQLRREVPLALALARAMPDVISRHEQFVRVVEQRIADAAPIALFIDGYDEIRTDRPVVAQRLDEVASLLDQQRSCLVVTTRPATVPQRRYTRVMASCELQPFGEREQSRFVERWFRDRDALATRVGQWIGRRRLELLRTPLLIALFCAVSGRDSDAPPENEPELWSRALLRLASQEDRFEEVSETSELVRLRIEALDAIAPQFVEETGIADSVPVSRIENALAGSLAWRSIERLSERATVVDELAATGIVRKVTGEREPELVFLHSALRDYLLARNLSREDQWASFMPRLWAQPEWEPVIGYLGALVAEPDELLLGLETWFADDPLNAARFTAGRVISAGGARVAPEHRERVRDELLILLGSADDIDRSRAAALLSSLQDSDTAEKVRSLVNPAVPTRTVTAALRTIAGGASSQSIETLDWCARNPRFVLREQEAAVEGLADTGSDGALSRLASLSVDADVEPVVRAAAAMSTLRRFGDESIARALLESTDDARNQTRRALAEHLAAQAHGFRDFLGRVHDGEIAVTDQYCMALFRATEGEEAAAEGAALVLPSNRAVDLLAAAVEVAREGSENDPLVATVGRFILSSFTVPSLRWKVANNVLSCNERTAEAMWPTVTDGLTFDERVAVARFLVSEVDVLPDELGQELRVRLESGMLGPVGLAAIQEPSAPQTAPETKDEEAVEPPESVNLEQVLSSTAELSYKYRQLRELRRTIPDDGPLRTQAAGLTHSYSVSAAVTWINALPAVAPLVERRLESSLGQLDLARLRMNWPGRSDEVNDSLYGLEDRAFDVRAEAALLADDVEEAATFALASIGSSIGEGRHPSPHAVTLMFAAGVASGQPAGVLDQTMYYLAQLPASQTAALLFGWTCVAHRMFDEARETVRKLPPHLRAASAGVAALSVVLGENDGDPFGDVISWADCKRASALLSGVKGFAESDSVRERIETARTMADGRARELASAWPLEGLDPGDRGTPRWSGRLVQAAATCLFNGSPEAAVAIYEAAIEGADSDASLINNLGFCMMPIDVAVAREHLDRAAALYGRPFGVNVANRLLAYDVLQDDVDAALELAESFYGIGPTERGSVWLWDIDDRTILRDDVDVLEYVIELALKAAQRTGRPPLIDRWRRRLQLRRAQTSEDDDCREVEAIA